MAIGGHMERHLPTVEYPFDTLLDRRFLLRKVFQLVPKLQFWKFLSTVKQVLLQNEDGGRYLAPGKQAAVEGPQQLFFTRSNIVPHCEFQTTKKHNFQLQLYSAQPE